MTDHVYKLLELTGSSPLGIEDAIQKAIAKANETVRNIHWFVVTETRGHVDDGKVAHWQVTAEDGIHPRLNRAGVVPRVPGPRHNRIPWIRRPARPRSGATTACAPPSSIGCATSRSGASPRRGMPRSRSP